MYYDPQPLRAAPPPASSAPPGLFRRIVLAFGGAPTPPPPPPPPETIIEDGPGVEALAIALAELISTAQQQVEGAADIVGRSAEEASAYRKSLAEEAHQLEASSLPADVAKALILATRTMIERSREAEDRLRLMSDELQGLNADLDEARAAAERDPLTGLPNRRALDRALAQAVELSREVKNKLTLAFCDIDQFKRINDKHGHALGDRVIRLVGDCLADGGGDNVFVGRQGGEEFVMLFEGAGAEDAAIRVDAIRAALAGRVLRSRTDDQPIGSITFSAGVAMLADGEDGEELLRRADKALYRAKRTGRNRVEIDRGD